MSILVLKDVSSGYGKKAVLYGISLEINNGQMVLVIGANGSGKSTLLKTIYGLLSLASPNSSIYFEGASITNCEPSALLRKGMVYIPQHNELFDSLTVKDNLYLSCMSAFRKPEQQQRVEETIETIPILKGLINRECNRLSGGERKLLSLGMALTNRPKLVLLDEPLAGVSPGNSGRIIEELNALRAGGITVLLVEHRVKDIFSYADRVVGLKHGRLFDGGLNSVEDTREVML